MTRVKTGANRIAAVASIAAALLLAGGQLAGMTIAGGWTEAFDAAGPRVQ